LQTTGAPRRQEPSPPAPEPIDDQDGISGAATGCAAGAGVLFFAGALRAAFFGAAFFGAAFFGAAFFAWVFFLAAAFAVFLFLAGAAFFILFDDFFAFDFFAMIVLPFEFAPSPTHSAPTADRIPSPAEPPTQPAAADG
jgi:hypothetical protein